MLEQSSVELENTISDLEEKNDHVEDEGNNLLVFMKTSMNLLRFTIGYKTWLFNGFIILSTE